MPFDRFQPLFVVLITAVIMRVTLGRPYAMYMPMWAYLIVFSAVWYAIDYAVHQVVAFMKR